jgi:hypothetical protein
LEKLRTVTLGAATAGPSGTKGSASGSDAEGAEQAIIYPIDDAPQ